ncbi:MAG: tetratricopeptide repeat protein [Opitutaceae bacterium]|nr:tetratricopeptide repeat protein [Verrucomicrobiales bacterium]
MTDDTPMQLKRFLQPTLAILVVGLSFCGTRLDAADATGSSSTPLVAVEADQIIRENLRLQAQLLSIERGIEQVRAEAEAASKRNVEAMTARMTMIEEALTAQRQREIQAIQESNRAMLIVAGVLSAAGVLALLFTAWVQSRAMNRITELTASLSTTMLPAHGFAFSAIGPGGTPAIPEAARQSSNQLVHAIEQLEKRIHELEAGASESAHPRPVSNADLIATSSSAPVAPPDAESPDGRISVLLGKGQTFLNMNQPGEALECFQEVLKLEPDSIDALLKKGAALERMQRNDEALQSYDRVLSLDGSVTTAYLYKGGVFNRLKRYAEALDCYEQALNTQQKKQRTLSSS